MTEKSEVLPQNDKRKAQNDVNEGFRMMVLLGLPRFARNDSELLEVEIIRSCSLH